MTYKWLLRTLVVMACPLFPSTGGVFAAEPLHQTSSSIRMAAQREFSDSEGSVYTELLPEFEVHREYLQSLVDQTTRNLMKTNYGRHIASDILQCKAHQIFRHLGVSLRTAEAISEDCLANPTPLSRPEVFPSDIKPKLGIRRGDQKKYAFILTNSDKWLYDSWTSANTNRTFIIIRQKGEKFTFSSIDPLFLHQALAHELAVYFDAKTWPCSEAWEQIPEFKGSGFKFGSNAVPCAALNNPLINHALTYIRAYRVEREMINDLITMGVVHRSIDELYPQPHFRFLESDLCDNNCLFEIVAQYARSPYHQILPLLAFAPAYRRGKLQTLNYLVNVPEDEILYQRVLESSPKMFMDAYNSRDPFFNIVDPLQLIDKELADEVMETFSSALLPSDLAILANNKIVWSDGREQPLWEFMAKPLLSGLNVALASGPRPRIRSGLIGGNQ